MSLPACEAVIEQVPAPVIVTVAGEVSESSVHGPVAASDTVRPELAVGSISNVASPKVCGSRLPNVIVWSALAIWNVR